VIERRSMEYLEAGADIIETNTFNGTTISMADYDLDTVLRSSSITTPLPCWPCTAQSTWPPTRFRKFVAGAPVSQQDAVSLAVCGELQSSVVSPTTKLCSHPYLLSSEAEQGYGYCRLSTDYSHQPRHLDGKK
jgi:hypothetical protein